MKVAVIGAGWGGMAAAVQAAQAGHAVTVFEAGRAPGGRARAVAAQRADGTPVLLDNGQHILIGAYTECLRLMRAVGVDPDQALLRLPLQLVFPDGAGLQLPDVPPPGTRSPASPAHAAGAWASAWRCWRARRAGAWPALPAHRAPAWPACAPACRAG